MKFLSLKKINKLVSQIEQSNSAEVKSLEDKLLSDINKMKQQLAVLDELRKSLSSTLITLHGKSWIKWAKWVALGVFSLIGYTLGVGR
jgi:hypothetical protein